MSVLGALLLVVMVSIAAWVVFKTLLAVLIALATVAVALYIVRSAGQL